MFKFLRHLLWFLVCSAFLSDHGRVRRLHVDFTVDYVTLHNVNDWLQLPRHHIQSSGSCDNRWARCCATTLLAVSHAPIAQKTTNPLQSIQIQVNTPFGATYTSKPSTK